jgi:hypothetical protein
MMNRLTRFASFSQVPPVHVDECLNPSLQHESCFLKSMVFIDSRSILPLVISGRVVHSSLRRALLGEFSQVSPPGVGFSVVL